MLSPLAAFVRGLPKAELHLHLEGTLEPELKFRLARRNGIELPQRSEEEVRATYRFHDLSSFLQVYYPAMAVLREAVDFHDLAYEYLRRVHTQGVRHVEMFFDPQAHTSRGVPFASVVSGYRSAIVRARREFGISAELIMCFLRDLPAEYAMATLLEALPYRHWIIGVGLDSDERGNPPRKFAAVFERARREGFLLTMHCDIDQPDSLEHIRQALEDIGVDRLDHGTNIVSDDRLVELARTKGIALTCCPISNSVVTEQMKAPEIVTLLDRGLLVTINSDDPAYFSAYIADNYTALAEQGELTREQLITLAANSFRASWITPARQEAFLGEIDSYVGRA
ncbi:adenosine deaminase [Nocardia sp. CDC159]|uniref:Adenine deaminase n=1 Tax=Nocardia pulmonis TaxID=2951408 RepID=A0A9X2IWH8_9NOCA|nr:MULTISPECIES: adenosine deaminase [Nocardia]MCM6773574.1 adenosine deaminase [Nocardia pulmonis]MCM6786461.1 adenosine deaminase [Nocardia sp. CDC159]